MKQKAKIPGTKKSQNLQFNEERRKKERENK
jgi:hypothetical protein